jgi:hypothetical protein
MKVFAAYDPRKIRLVRAWIQSWEARGWRPQLLSEREVKDYRSARLAAKARGGGLLSDLCVINFSFRFRFRSKDSRRSVQVGKRGWATASLVRFPSTATERDIWECGRKI